MWDFNNEKPVYMQIMEEIKAKVISGEYTAGQRIPSVRELAEDARVNPNTMQKALMETEREGLIFSMRTSGKYITNDVEMISNLKTETAKKELDIFFKRMNKIGLKKEEIIEIINNNYN